MNGILRYFIIAIIIISDVYLSFAQIGFELILDRPNSHDYFCDLKRDNSGNCYSTYCSKPVNDNAPTYYSTSLYKIFPDGDTLVQKFQKEDTIINFGILDIDYQENLLMGGNAFLLDSLGEKYKTLQYFIKLNTDLEILWEKVFSLDPDSVKSVNSRMEAIYDDKYIYVCNTFDLNTHLLSMYAFTFSFEGDSLDFKVFAPEHYGLISSILLDSLNHTIDFHMDRAPSTTGYSSVRRMKLDTNLGFISLEAYPNRYFDDPFATLSYSGQQIVSGGAYYNSDIEKDFINARIMDSSLNIVNEAILCDGEKETYPAWNVCIDYYYPNRIFVAGMYHFPAFYPNEPNWLYVACLNSNLDIIHEEYIGGDAFYEVANIVATPDGGAILSGTIYDHLSNSYQKDGYVLKIDSAMFVSVNPTLDTETIEVNVSKVSNKLDIYNELNEAVFSLYDISGKLLLKNKISKGSSSISTGRINHGIYIWTIQNNKHCFNGKIHI